MGILSGSVPVSSLITTGQATGDIIYFNGTNWVRLARGSDDQYLRATATSIAYETVAAATTKNIVVNKTGGTALSFGETRYMSLSGEGGFGTTESNQDISISIAGTFKEFRLRVQNNTLDAATTVRTRKNAVNGNISVSVGSSTTGDFADSVNTDTIAAGDEYNYQFVVAGAAGSASVFASCIEFDPT